jgi:ecdysteroid 25-hydroxylase
MIKFLVEGKDKTHDHYRQILRDNAEFGPQCQNVVDAYEKEIASRVQSSQGIGTFTEPQVLHALADLFGAGVDTTLATLRWLLLFVAIHPDVQQRVKEELDSAVAAKSDQGRKLGNDYSACAVSRVYT